MEWNLAVMDDLPRLTSFYQEVVCAMRENGLLIWDEVYPCCALEGDISRGRLYLLTEGPQVLSAFSLRPSHPGGKQVTWPYSAASPWYLDRLAVSAACRRRGLGLAALRQAAHLAGRLGGDALRLFAVAENIPAIQLYHKAGFHQAIGEYEEVIDAELTLHELGFEQPIRP